MHLLRPYRSEAPGLPDLLNWGSVIDDGIVLCKDGSLLSGWHFRGQDLDSSPHERINWATEHVNRALSRLHGGWTLWVDAVRLPVSRYLPRETSYFPDPVSQMVEDERRQHFTSSRHFETEYAITIGYTPPIRHKSRVVDIVYDDDGSERTPAGEILGNYKRTLAELEDSLVGAIDIARMKDSFVTNEHGTTHHRSALVNYLHFCLTGEEMQLNLPPGGSYLDSVIGGKEFEPGDTPLVGSTYFSVIRITGYPASEWPGMLSVLDSFAMPLRYSSRFIYMDAPEARKQIIRIEKKWKQRMRGFWADVLKLPAPRVDQDALEMAEEAGEALAKTSSGLVATGYYTPVVVLNGKNVEQVLDNANDVKRELRRLGFEAEIETINAPEAWHGSLPGHTVQNVRRPPIHTDNMADFLPLTSVWTGSEENDCPFYPKPSPALLMAATTGETQCFVNLGSGDVKHTLVFGPIGSGKSTLLSTICLQALRYPGVTIWGFDKGRSALAAVKGCGGQHFDVTTDGSLAFCPLSVLEDDYDCAWAEEWIASCYFLQHNRDPSPEEREHIHAAINVLRMSDDRSLTHFNAAVQSNTVRDAMRHYTLEGPLGRLLDAEKDGLKDGRLVMFEIEDLMGMGEKNLIPVLLYLFRRFERQLRGQPAYLILDEAWIMLGHPVFREKIREWLKVLRKANCGVILATQSLSDAAGSGLLDVLMESCPTKIFLPNAEAASGGAAEFPGPVKYYQAFGLNEAQIDIIRTATPKRHYYVVSPEGCRLVDLQLGPIALSFVGVSDKKKIARINELHAKHGESWPFAWLKECGVEYPERYQEMDLAA